LPGRLFDQQFRSVGQTCWNELAVLL